MLTLMLVLWGRSSVWLEHSTVTREVAGSSPVGPVKAVSWLVRSRVGGRAASGASSRARERTHALTVVQRPGGETGRHAILRGWCRKASRFESVPGHEGRSSYDGPAPAIASVAQW